MFLYMWVSLELNLKPAGRAEFEQILQQSIVRNFEIASKTRWVKGLIHFQAVLSTFITVQCSIILHL
jgi:hypothetical protein